MIPIRDEIPTHRFPLVNYLLIAANIGMYILQASQGAGGEAFIRQYAMIPARLLGDPSLQNAMTLLTSMFMHAGVAHIGGNMLYLWIFGDNVEDAMGHARYLVFYLLGGLVASFAHIYFNPGSTIPTLGASGAVATSLGAYLLLYPGSRVLTIIPFGFFLRLTALPAVIVLGLWFVLQFFQGVLMLGASSTAGGVAVWAHVGGFVAGFVLARLFVLRRKAYHPRRW
jgi:membrane associated rhomboid family serine protease